MEKLNTSCNDDNSFIHRKRKNILNESIEESANLSKKSNSEKTKEKSKYIHFIAEINQNYNKTNIDSEDKLEGDELNIKKRKQKARDIIQSIKSEKDELEKINKALLYNNTDKYIIYRLLSYYFKKNDKENYEESVNKYKFCITKKFTVFEGIKEISVDLNNYFGANEFTDELEELPNLKPELDNIKDLRNSVVSLFTDYFYLAKYYKGLSGILSATSIREILTVKIKEETSINNKKILSLDYEKVKKSEILDSKKEKIEAIDKDFKLKLLNSIENFLFKYVYMKEFEFFRHNQPINYESNLSLYYNYIIYSLYEISVQPDISGKMIFLKESKLRTYFTLSSFHSLLFDEFFDSSIVFNKTMDQLLQYLLFLLSSGDFRFFNDAHNFLNFKKIDPIIDNDSIQKFVEQLNSDFITAKRENDQIIFDENLNPREIKINVKDYSPKLLNNTNGIETLNILWEKLLFEKFQEKNFFLENDIKYLKYLIKHILLSPLFKEIFLTFSNVSSIAEYYFLDERNVDDYIERIIFFPYKLDDVGKYGETDRNTLTVFVSGFTNKDIKAIEQYRIIRIIELASRVVTLSCHEPSHFIKAVYAIITEGKISRYTSENDKNVDSGFYLEEILFNWIQDKNAPLDLSKLKLAKNIVYNNKPLMDKKIDLITALTLLNPDIYNSNLTHFRKSLFEITKENLKTFSFDNLEPTYKNYLNSVIDEATIRIYSENSISVRATKSEGDISIEYNSYNHNNKD